MTRRFGSRRPPVIDEANRALSHIINCTDAVFEGLMLEALVRMYPRVKRTDLAKWLLDETLARQARQAEKLKEIDNA